MKRSLISLSVMIPFLILFSGILQGQNQLDIQGRKTGPWKVEYPNGNTLYEGSFAEGNPVGLMIRYYEDGAVRARMMFDSIGERSYATLLHKSGKKAAEGWYVNKVKDSVWTYYSEFDGTVRIKEPYSKGNIHGVTRSFYPGGTVSEEVNWVENKKEGHWKQYYDDGSLRLESSYKNDMLNGLYRVYSPDSTLMITGTFLDDQSHGNWSYFDKEGSNPLILEYQYGRPVDEEKYMELMQDSARIFNIEQEPGSIEHF